jgi:hypothetical protein
VDDNTQLGTKEPYMPDWTSALKLDTNRKVIGGSSKALADAVRDGADLRIYTEFRHNEHIDVTSDNNELIREVSEFRETLLIDDRWSAGFMTLRQPVELPDGFGDRPSLSLFMYNEDGTQAIARPHLDGPPAGGTPGPTPLGEHGDMPKYHQLDSWDGSTNAPSSNFIYDFEEFDYWVRNDWRQVLSHSADGEVVSGSIEELEDAFKTGSEVKVGVSGLCDGVVTEGDTPINHELFIQVGYGYYYTGEKLFIGATHPFVRIKPAIPVRYTSRGWDYGWAMCRTDGKVALSMVDPYTLSFSRSEGHHAIRWFVR